MSTILGEYIEVVRPSLIRLPQKTKIRSKRHMHTKTTVNSKVIEVCIETINGKVYGIPQGSHIDVLTTHSISAYNVSRTGWKLEDNTYIWR